MNYFSVNRIKQIAAIFVSFSLLGASSQEPIQISEDLSCKELKEGVYQITHVFPRFGSNSMFVLLPGAKGVLIDTPHETSGTKDLLEWIHKTFGKLELHAINTGWHQDNLGGNYYLIQQGIPVYGPDLTAELISKRGEELKNILLSSTESTDDKRYYKAYKSLNLVPPDHIFPIGEGLALEIEGEVIEVYFPGESHTIDNTVVYLHKRDVLFGGCMILSLRSQRPGFTEHANMKEWPLSVKRVLDTYPSPSIVIPGHGLHGDVSLLKHTIEVLERFNRGNPE